jgi:hypothetical protein
MSDTIIINSKQRTSNNDSSTDFKLSLLYPLEEGTYSLKYAYIPNLLRLSIAIIILFY